MASVISIIFFLMSIGSMLHSIIKKWLCRPVEFKGQGPLRSSLVLGESLVMRLTNSGTQQKEIRLWWRPLGVGLATRAVSNVDFELGLLKRYSEEQLRRATRASNSRSTACRAEHFTAFLEALLGTGHELQEEVGGEGYKMAAGGKFLPL